MSRLTGMGLLQAVANRIVIAYLESQGYSNVREVATSGDGYARSRLRPASHDSLSKTP